MKKVDIDNAITMYGKPKITLKKRIISLVLTTLMVISIVVALYYRKSKIKIIANEFPNIDLQTAQIVVYNGNCKCPEDKDKTGKLCGKRSAWSRGANVICYDSNDNLLKR